MVYADIREHDTVNALRLNFSYAQEVVWSTFPQGFDGD